MVGQPESGNLGSTDWLKNATPEHLVTQGKAIFAKIASMDSNTQRQFVDGLRGEPTAARLFEKVATGA